MSPEIIVAIVSGLCSLLGALGGILASVRLTTYRIEQLEKKVDKHNKLIERMYGCEQAIEIIKTKIEKE